MIDAKKARIKVLSKKSRENFLKLAEEAVSEAIKKEEFIAKFIVYDDVIGDVHALYHNEPDKCLTETGKDLVKELEKLGYKVKLDLYYSEGQQFVDMRLRFTLTW